MWLVALRPPVTSLSIYSVIVLPFAKENKMPLYSCAIIALLPFIFGRLLQSSLDCVLAPSSLACGQPPLRQTIFLKKPGSNDHRRSKSFVFLSTTSKWALSPCFFPTPTWGKEAPVLKLSQAPPPTLLHALKKKITGSLFFQENVAQCTVQTLRLPLNSELSRY